MFSVQIVDSSLLLPGVIGCGAAIGPDEVWLQENVLISKCDTDKNGKREE